jgi:hypothetical protein
MRRSISIIAVTAVALAGTVFAACTATPLATPTYDFQAIADATNTAVAEIAAIALGLDVTPIPDGTLDVTPIPEGTLVDDAIASPIKATFFPDRQATEYTFEPVINAYAHGWEPVPCGAVSRSNEDRTMTWVHAHPPCDETTGHDAVTIRAVIFVSVSEEVGRTIICEYQGAGTGTGKACKWGGLRDL